MSVSQPLLRKIPGRLVLERSYSFSASHRYFRPDWPAERNRETFGRCANAPAHGHNYRLTVRVSGSVDRSTGFMVNLPELDALVEERIVRRLDHAHVNDALLEFGPGGEIPTTENLVAWIVGELDACLRADSRLEQVRLAEDERLASIWEREATA